MLKDLLSDSYYVPDINNPQNLKATSTFGDWVIKIIGGYKEITKSFVDWAAQSHEAG